MSRIAPRFPGDLALMRVAPTSDLKTRLRNLDWMDWLVILIVITGIWVAFYTTSLRHP